MRHARPGVSPPPAHELYDTAVAIKSLWHKMAHGFDADPETHGVRRQQHWVLIALSEGPRRMTDLAQCAQTSQASLTGIVDRLEEAGLVVRMRSAHDRRVVEVAVTPSGEEALASAMTSIAQRLETVIAPLDEAERREFVRMLNKMAASEPGCAEPAPASR